MRNLYHRHLVSFTRLKTARAAAGICAVKLEDSLSGILILAFFCGMLMYIAVDGYKSKGNPVILFWESACSYWAGFEHCIANMFYFTVAGVWSLKALVYILVMDTGKHAGGMFIPLFGKWVRGHKHTNGRRPPPGQEYETRGGLCFVMSIIQASAAFLRQDMMCSQTITSCPVLVEDFQSLCYKASVRMLWIFRVFLFKVTFTWMVSPMKTGWIKRIWSYP